MNEMLKRVAEAIDHASQPPGRPDYKMLMENCARAAIEAMREPTGEMSKEGRSAFEQSERSARQMALEGRTVMNNPHLAAWRAMIDAALAHS